MGLSSASLWLAENPRWPPASYKIETCNFKIKTKCHRSTNFHHLVSFTLRLTWNMDSMSIWIWLVRNTTLVQDGCRHHAKHTLEIQTKCHKSTTFSPFGQLFILLNLSHGATLSFSLIGWKSKMAAMGKIHIVYVGFKISTTCHSSTKLSAVVLTLTLIITIKVHI